MYVECASECLTCNGILSTNCMSCEVGYKFCEIDSVAHIGNCISSCQNDCIINTKSTYDNLTDNICYGIYLYIFV